MTLTSIDVSAQFSGQDATQAILPRFQPPKAVQRKYTWWVPVRYGWYIWGGDGSPSEDREFFVPLHVECLGDWCMAVIRLLALSPGWRFFGRRRVGGCLGGSGGPEGEQVTETPTREVPRQVAESIAGAAGIRLPVLNSSVVPAELRALVPHAEILGVGDDPVREEIVEALPPEYLRTVSRDVGQCVEALDAWLEDLDKREFPHHSVEHAAFRCLLESLESFSALESFLSSKANR
jgi:hypothetical protein